MDEELCAIIARGTAGHKPVVCTNTKGQHMTALVLTGNRYHVFITTTTFSLPQSTVRTSALFTVRVFITNVAEDAN